MHSLNDHWLRRFPLFLFTLSVGNGFALVSNATDDLKPQASSHGGVLIINDSPSGFENFDDLYGDVENAQQVFSGWDQKLLISSGPVSANELNAAAGDKNFDYVFDQHGLPILEHRNNFNALAANYDHVKSTLQSMESSLPKDQPLMVYIAGHGDVGETLLAGEKQLTVQNLRKIVNAKPADRKMIFAFDTCRSASMFPAIMGAPHACGFAAANGDEDSESGHLIMDEAIRKKTFSFSQVIRTMQFDNDVPSLPRATSDYFLEHYEARQANKSSEACVSCGVPAQGKGDPNTKATTRLKQSIAINFLQSEMRVLRQDMVLAQSDPSLTKLFLPGSVPSESEIQTSIKQLQAKLVNIEKLNRDLQAIDQRNRIAHEEKKIGPENYKKYSRMSDELDDLREALENKTNPAIKKKIQSQIDQLEPRYKVISQQVDRLEIVADYKKNDLESVQELNHFRNQRSPNFKCPSDLTSANKSPTTFSECLIALDAAQVATHQTIRPLLRFQLAAKKLKALASMEKNEDFLAIQKFLDLKECENTLIRNQSEKRE